MGLSYSGFSALFRQVKDEAFHLEMRDSYGTETETSHLAKWAAGNPGADLGWLKPWCTLIRDATRGEVRHLPEGSHTRKRASPDGRSACTEIQWRYQFDAPCT